LPLITFNQKQLPTGSTVSITGNDLVVKMDSKTNFPHLTFHANSASKNADGSCRLMYTSVARYHVAVRSGVYFGRQFQVGWKDDPSDTTERIMGSDKKDGESMALDIEQILKVS
jgi:hypothetical protein